MWNLGKQTQRNLGGTFRGTFWQPKTEENRTPQNLENLSVEPWWNLGGTLVEPCRELGGTLVEPLMVRKQFCPETFTMAEDPKAVTVGEQLRSHPTLEPLYQKIHHESR